MRPDRAGERTDSWQALVDRTFAGHARLPPYSTGKMGAPRKRLNMLRSYAVVSREGGTERLPVSVVPR